MSDEKEDIRDILQTFWLRIVEGEDAMIPERLKASEYLAKYFLADGRPVKRDMGPSRPATAEVLKLAAALEKGNGFTMRDLEEEPDE